jgi:hypothetical protein
MQRENQEIPGDGKDKTKGNLGSILRETEWKLSEHGDNT